MVEDDEDTTRMKINDETKIRMTPSINYSRLFGLQTRTHSLKSQDISQARSIVELTRRDLPDDKGEQHNHGVVKFYSPVTRTCLPASNLEAITERLEDLIRSHINTHGTLDRTLMDK